MCRECQSKNCCFRMLAGELVSDSLLLLVVVGWLFCCCLFLFVCCCCLFSFCFVFVFIIFYWCIFMLLFVFVYCFFFLLLFLVGVCGWGSGGGGLRGVPMGNSGRYHWRNEQRHHRGYIQLAQRNLQHGGMSTELPRPTKWFDDSLCPAYYF